MNKWKLGKTCVLMVLRYPFWIIYFCYLMNLTITLSVSRSSSPSRARFTHKEFSLLQNSIAFSLRIQKVPFYSLKGSKKINKKIAKRIMHEYNSFDVLTYPLDRVALQKTVCLLFSCFAWSIQLWLGREFSVFSTFFRFSCSLPMIYLASLFWFLSMQAKIAPLSVQTHYQH